MQIPTFFNYLKKKKIAQLPYFLAYEKAPLTIFK